MAHDKVKPKEEEGFIRFRYDLDNEYYVSMHDENGDSYIFSDVDPSFIIPESSLNFSFETIENTINISFG